VLPVQNAARAVASGNLRRIKISGFANMKFGTHQICGSYINSSPTNDLVSVLLAALKQYMKGAAKK
jgi:hypothetical protein